MKKHKFFLISIFSVATMLFLVYYFPLQRFMAERRLATYMALQEVDTTQIESISYHKDYTQDGYSVFVRFFDDDYLYVYRYYLLSTGEGSNIRYDSMYCDVYDKENSCLDGPVEGMKYKSLEWLN